MLCLGSQASAGIKEVFAMTSSAGKIIILLTLNSLVWTLDVMVLRGSLKFYARGGIPANFETDPPRTRVWVDGKLYEDMNVKGGWMQSPATIRLLPGQHKITLERDGYVPHSFKLIASESDQIQMKTVLERNADANGEVDIVAEGADEYRAEIDNGHEAGHLPLTADDLTPGAHTLSIKLEGLEGFRVKPHTCQFTVAAQQTQRLTLTVSRSGKKIKVSGCRKIKSAN